LERLANARAQAGDMAAALHEQQRSLEIARQIWTQSGESSWEFGRTLAISLLRTGQFAGQAGQEELASQCLGQCFQLLAAFDKASTQLDPAMKNLLSQLRQGFGDGK
jgi:hypothetical protein